MPWETIPLANVDKVVKADQQQHLSLRTDLVNQCLSSYLKKLLKLLLVIDIAWQLQNRAKYLVGVTIINNSFHMEMSILKMKTHGMLFSLLCRSKRVQRANLCQMLHVVKNSLLFYAETLKTIMQKNFMQVETTLEDNWALIVYRISKIY